MSQLALRLKEEEKQYRSEGPLYVDKTLIKFNDLRSFLIEFFENYNENFNTYYDPECKQTQTYSNCHRSLGDIYRIILSFRDDIPLIDVATELVLLVENYYNPDSVDFGYIRTLKCEDIGRRVYYPYDYEEDGSFSSPCWYCGSQEHGGDEDRMDEFDALPEDYLALAN